MDILVGDTVMDQAYLFSGEVIGLYGKRAWVRHGDNERPVSSLIDDLTLIERRAEEAA